MAKKFPRLEDIMGRKAATQKRRKTAAEMEAIIRTWFRKE